MQLKDKRSAGAGPDVALEWQAAAARRQTSASRKLVRREVAGTANDPVKVRNL
jgi:hypothetical protein